ncbi:hypothetical protein [Halarchaeum salinum]
MIVVDITCPDCGCVDTVEKRALDAYYCRACERTFDTNAVR